MNGVTKHLVLCDFDGTLAATFEDSPNGVNVNIASDRAVLDVFGEEGYRRYQEIGGLSNREPGDLVRLIRNGVGIEHGQEDLTRQYIETKLSYLVPEISQAWPRLYPGVEKIFGNREDDLPVNFGILSSGHERFIRRVFEVNSLPDPEILVTSDDLRSRRMPERDRFKPNPYQLAVAHHKWKGLMSGDGLQVHTDGGNYLGRNHNKPNMIYVGDDPKKDGGLAEQSRIPFVFVPFTSPAFVPREEHGQLLVPDFFTFSGILRDNVQALGEGKAFSQIFFGRDDAELFPPLPEGNRPYNSWLAEGTQNGAVRERGY